MTTQPNELDVLKAQVQTLKRIVYGFGCLFVAGIALAATSMQGVPDVIQAKKFEVVNDEGKVMGHLRTDKLGGGRLVINNRNEKEVASLGEFAFGGGLLVINNKDEKEVASLGQSTAGAVLNIRNNDCQTVARLGESTDGAVLSIRNKDGELTFSAP